MPWSRAPTVRLKEGLPHVLRSAGNPLVVGGSAT
jgi:hypothetical protein